MIRCLSCGAETSNGLALCDLCRLRAETYLEFIPVHFGNLSRWRPGRAGSRPVPGSREPQGALGGSNDDRVARCLDEAGSTLATRVRQLEDDRGVDVPYAADEVNTVRVACWLLGEHLVSISTLDWCGDLVTDLHEIEETLRKVAEQVVPGWYAGACETCQASTYVVPGLTWVTCRTCGTTTPVSDRLPIILAEARPWVGTPRKIAEALVAMLDEESDVERLWERIRRWGRAESTIRDRRTGEVKRVIPAGPLHGLSVRRIDSDGDEVGARHFRLGDVVDLLKRDTRSLTRAG